MENNKTKSPYDKFVSIMSIFAVILLFILGMINLTQELPDKISNQTILIFVIAFGVLMVNRD